MRRKPPRHVAADLQVRGRASSRFGRRVRLQPDRHCPSGCDSHPDHEIRRRRAAPARMRIRAARRDGRHDPPETSTPGAKAARTGGVHRADGHRQLQRARTDGLPRGMKRLDEQCRQMHGTAFLQASALPNDVRLSVRSLVLSEPSGWRSSSGRRHQAPGYMRRFVRSLRAAPRRRRLVLRTGPIRLRSVRAAPMPRGLAPPTPSHDHGNADSIPIAQRLISGAVQQRSLSSGAATQRRMYHDALSRRAARQRPLFLMRRSPLRTAAGDAQIDPYRRRWPAHCRRPRPISTGFSDRGDGTRSFGPPAASLSRRWPAGVQTRPTPGSAGPSPWRPWRTTRIA
jgi:hypothetical protein